MSVVQATFLGSMLLVTPLGVSSAIAANPSADLDQCANEPAPSPPSNGCNPDEWVNGNLGASKSVYFEGDSIPYRMKFDNLDTSTSHTVIIEWDTTKSGKHAIDYLTAWNRTVLDADPCVGVAGCASSTTFPIPVDPQVSGGGVTPVAGNFTFFGGTITSVSAYSYPDGAGFTGDKSAQIAVTFTTTVANPVLAWGGHIATRADWGLANSAVAIPGSPYHMRLIDLDGAGGNQDRSLSEAAVIFPGSITIIKQATPEGSTQFSFTASPTPLTNFNLVDDGTSANTKVFSNIIDFKAYTVTETVPTGWGLTNRACNTTSPNGGSTSNSGSFGVSITLAEGENVTCTFTNAETANPSLNVTKDAAESSVDAAGDVINYTIVVTNTGNVALHDVSVNDPLLSDEDCDGTPGAPFVNTGFTIAVGGSLSCTGTYTVTQADIDSNGGGDGDIDNTVTADSDETGPDTADETVLILQSAGLNVTKVAAEANVDAAGDVINYTIKVYNTGNVTLTGVSVNDPLLSNEDCDGVPGVPYTNTGVTINVGGSITCTGTYTVAQADIDNNGGGDGDIDNTVTADSNETGPDTASAEVPILQAPSLSISKVDDVDSFDEVGDVIGYTIQARNTGNVTLHDVVVTDPNVSDLVCVPATPVADLAPNATIDCTASHTVTQADLDAGSFLNQACVDDGDGGATGKCAEVTTPGDQVESLAIEKLAGESGFDSVGDVINYTITVTNDGNVTLHDVVVTDAQVSDLDCTPTTPVADLAPGDTITCTASHTIDQGDIDFGSFWNQACTDDEEGAADTGAAPICDDVTTPGAKNPHLAITKDDDVDGFDSVGDVIGYTITATNDGNVTLHNVVVTDPNVSDLVCTPTTPVLDLAPGESISCTASHTIVQADIDLGSFFNQACVDDGDGGAESQCDDVTTPGDKNPHLAIVKIATESGFDSVGDVINYTITATNDGNVTLHGVVVTDPNVGDLSCTPTLPVADLAPGDEITCTASHTITQPDLDEGSFFNQACVDDGAEGADSICDDVETPGSPNPLLGIDKVAAETGYDAVGDVIHYTIEATNIGNVTLHDVVVTDPNVSDLECTPALPVADLAPGDSITCTATHTVVQADFEAAVFNQACVDDGEGGAVEVCDDVTTFGEETGGETAFPTLPNTAGASPQGGSRPVDGAWLILVLLGMVLTGIVALTPRRNGRRI